MIPSAAVWARRDRPDGGGEFDKSVR